MMRCRIAFLALALVGGAQVALAREELVSGGAATSSAQRAEAVPPALDEVLITARRREESSQRAPLSVVAFDADELERRSFSHLRDLQQFVPNLTFAPSQNVGEAAGNVFIRGIGQEDFVPGTEPGVALYVDGVYVARAMGTLRELLDVERVEVVRGPQGTLYGKNAIGGVINLISRAPVDGLTYSLGLTAGSLGRREARAMLNAPLAPGVLVRLSVLHGTRDGYVRRLPASSAGAVVLADRRAEGGGDSTGGRAQLRWLWRDDTTLDAVVDVSRRRGTQGATHLDALDTRQAPFPTIARLIASGQLPGPAIDGSQAASDLLTTQAGSGNELAIDSRGVALTGRLERGSNTFSAIAAFRELKSRITTDLDGLSFALVENEFAEHSRQYSLELQAIGAAAFAAWSAGLFALEERLTPLPVEGLPDVLYDCGCFYAPTSRPLRLAAVRRLRADSYAAYAQLEVPVVTRLRATVGARYSREHKSIDAQLVRLDPDSLRLTDVVVATGAQGGSWNALTWRAGLEFQADESSMLYLSASRGYKSGWFNVRLNERLPNLGLTPFAPETALTAEAGLRSEWLGRRLRVNATAFDTDYRDVQLRQQTVVGGVGTTVIENAARARIRGIEAEITAQVTDRLAARLAFGHLHARYLDVGRVPGLTRATRLQRTPSDSLAAAADYVVPLRSGALALHVDWTWRSREQFQLTPTPWDQGAYGMWRGRLGLHSQSGLSIALFGTNLADVRYRTAGRATLLSQTGIAYSSVGLPRQFGVEITLTR